MTAARDPAVSMAEAAVVLGCPVAQVAALIDAGELGFVVDPALALIQVPVRALDDFVTDHPTLPSGEADPATTDPPVEQPKTPRTQQSP